MRNNSTRALCIEGLGAVMELEMLLQACKTYIGFPGVFSDV